MKLGLTKAYVDLSEFRLTQNLFAVNWLEYFMYPFVFVLLMVDGFFRSEGILSQGFAFVALVFWTYTLVRRCFVYRGVLRYLESRPTGSRKHD